MKQAQTLAKLQRRQWLALAAAGTSAWLKPALAASTAAAPHQQLAAAWEAAHGYQVGVLAYRSAAMEVSAALDVPTRAHGVWAEAGGTLLAVARRPGDWLLRWRPESAGQSESKAITWAWAEPDRAFNGHVIASPDGKTLYTTETNLETGEGLIGVRDAGSLEKSGEWPTHGMDPHELLLDGDGSLVVANGGIPALPETGRLKIHMERMDASLVRLDARGGALLGQWRLADKRLSLRHLAWGESIAGGMPGQRMLGIALQAEHDDAAAKAAAPVLAVFDGRRLQAHGAPGPRLAGYGGDIAPIAGGFAVSCPRANGVALWHSDGRWTGFLPLQEACALASAAAPGGKPSLWAAGRLAALTHDSEGTTHTSAIQDLRLDNHWTPLG